MIPPSTPIDETLRTMKVKLDVPSHVRTAGDLVVAIERGEVDIDEKTARAAALLNYMDSPAFIESLYRTLEGLRTLSKPGITFTPEQKALIQKMQDEDDSAGAQRIILDKLDK